MAGSAGRVTAGARRGRDRGSDPPSRVRTRRSGRGRASRATAWPISYAWQPRTWTACPAESWYAGTRPLARHILDTGDLAPVPALLGALTEAGCDHPTVLDALSEPLVPVEACWMVETLAGAEPGTLLRRVV